MSTDRPVIREIITKAVCGRGTYRYQRLIDLELPAGQKSIQVLGHFVSNAGLAEAAVVNQVGSGKAVRVKGHYDVHIWYAFDQDTRAAKTTVTFSEDIPIQMFGGEDISGQQAVAEITQQPRCRKAYVKNLGEQSVVRVEIDQDLAAEVVGITKLKVGTIPATAASTTGVTGQELLPPQKLAAEYVSSTPNYCLDLKCEEDLPEEDDEDYE